jgi:hypothetical protein
MMRKAHHNDGEFSQATPEEQQIAVACKILIQNNVAYKLLTINQW